MAYLSFRHHRDRYARPFASSVMVTPVSCKSVVELIFKGLATLALIVVTLNLPGQVYAYDPALSIPEKITDMKSGEISKATLLLQPQLIVVANRDAFEVIEETAEVFTYPPNTVWVPNISAAPGWVIRLFIKPALKETAEKVSARVIYDPEGEWARSLKITSEDDEYLAVFYADSQGVVKIMEKTIPAKVYEGKEEKISLGEEILTFWKEKGVFD